MSESASERLSIATRYATATFESAKEQRTLDIIEQDTMKIMSLLGESSDFLTFLNSPLTSRNKQINIIASVSKAMSLDKLMSSVLGVMALKRRLFVVPYLVIELQRLLSEEKGEITAEVISASKLSDEQYDKLAEVLSKSTGNKVRIEATTDETILGGLIVKVGSRMLDTSIRAKLDSLQANMKEVG